MIRNERSSNIELLRCVLMLMIVIIHFLGHNILSAAEPIEISNQHFYTANLLLCFCECAVDCFVLISGYFTINFSLKKLIMFLLPIAFYQLVLSIVYHYVDGSAISFSPFSYWFVRPFVALMIISPLLNKGLNFISKKKLLIILGCASLFFVLPIHSLSGMDGKNAFIFIYLYCLGYYLRNFFDNRYSAAFYFFMFLMLVVLNFSETIALAKVGQYKGTATLSYSYDNILIVLQAVFLMLFFTKFNFHSKLINGIAVSSFFVYIITENINVYSNPNYSIYKILDVKSWEGETYFIFYIIVASIMLFVVAIIIDKIRLLMFSKLEKTMSEKISTFEQKSIGSENTNTNKTE